MAKSFLSTIPSRLDLRIRLLWHSGQLNIAILLMPPRHPNGKLILYQGQT
ncbi:MAG: hypothetical protein WBR10_10410 [Candidatus Acidiferrum sp.]